jgi:hypothetical protein
MHRPSAMDNLAAPLSHHWQDATHISFGVLTAGVFGEHWKLEGSAFNGREPNEERWGFDRLRLDSYSGRFTVHMDSSWVFSAGYGYLESPEALHPSESVHRVTASVLHGRKLGMDGQIATSVIWGANRRSGRTTHSALAQIRFLDVSSSFKRRPRILCCQLDLVGSLQTRRSPLPPCPSDTFAKWFECRKRRLASDSRQH